MNLAEEALIELYPGLQERRKIILNYHGRFKGYNGNIRWSSRHAPGDGFVEVRLSREWEDVSPMIQKGLIQHLFLKLYKNPAQTEAMRLYDSFIKNLSKVALVTKQDPLLLERFRKINEEYFDNALDAPNLVWGGPSFHKLGTYTYASDTIMMSGVFKGVADADVPMLDYVLYHEMIHKAEQFTTKNGRMRSHTKAFRDKEKKFKIADAEGKLQSFLRKTRRGGAFEPQEFGGGKRLARKKTLLNWFFD